VGRIALIVVLLLGLSAAANAAEPKAKGPYAGASYGLSVFDDDGATGGSYLDDEDTAFQVYGGYKFLKYFAVEARYIDFGSFSDGFDSLDLSAVSLHAVGIIPFGTSGWELFGQLGYGKITQKVLDYDRDDNAGSGGIGVRWYLNPSFAFTAQINVFVWQNDDIGDYYDLSVGANQLGIQFNF
jgi:OOP family OmpA-OmpF porin